jgi:hypothetical protein
MKLPKLLQAENRNAFNKAANLKFGAAWKLPAAEVAEA